MVEDRSVVSDTLGMPRWADGTPSIHQIMSQKNPLCDDIIITNTGSNIFIVAISCH